MVIRSLIALIAIISAAVHSPALAQSDPLPKIAVFEAATTPASTNTFRDYLLEAGELTRQIEEGLRASRRFEVFERSTFVMSEAIDAERELALDKNFEKNAAAFGKKANVQFIVYPMITYLNFNIRQSAMEENPGRFRYSATGSVAITTKVLDTDTGQIAYQATREVPLPSQNDIARGINGPNDRSTVTANAWRFLARSAGVQITNAVVGSLFPVQVMQANGADIFVNRGEGAGIEVGDIFQLFAAGEALIDPVTKEKLGDAETLIGEAQVARVTPRFSVLKATSPLSAMPKAGDVARPKSKP